MPQDNGKSLPMPPYISFRTFTNFLVKLAQGVPPRIDRSFLNISYSGALGSQLLTALRFLGLIEGKDNKVTAELERLVEGTEARKQLLRQLLQDRYAPVFTDIGDLSKATSGQVEQSFKQRFDVDGETRRKAITFFIHAAQEADIPISIYITTSTKRKRAPNSAIRKSMPKMVRQSSDRLVHENATAPKSEREDAPSSKVDSVANGHAKTITLRKRESLVLIYTGDVLNMDREDRAFLFHLIDEMEDHAQENSETLGEEDMSMEES